MVYNIVSHSKLKLRSRFYTDELKQKLLYLHIS